MWIIIYSLAGVVIGSIGSIMVMKISPIVSISFAIFFYIAGIFLGFKKQFRISREKGEGAGGVGVGIGFVLALVIAGLCSPWVPILNPVAFLGMFVQMPFMRMKSDQMVSEAKSRAQFDKSLTLSRDGMSAGLGINPGTQSVAVTSDKELLILGNTDAPFSNSSGELGPVLKISEGKFDYEFIKNMTTSIHTVTGLARSATGVGSGNQTSFIGELNSGSYLFGMGFEKYLFAVHKDGTVDPEFKIQKDHIVSSLMLGPKGDYVLVGRQFYQQGYPPNTHASIEQLDVRGEVHTLPSSQSGKSGKSNIYALHIFPNGSFISMEEAASKSLFLLSPDGKILSEKQVPYYLPWARKYSISQDRIIFVFPTQNTEHPEFIGVTENGFEKPALDGLTSCSSAIPYGFIPEPDGGLILAGGFKCGDEWTGLIKVNTDGSLDKNFLRLSVNSGPKLGSTVEQPPIVDSKNNIYLLTRIGKVLRFRRNGLYDSDFTKSVEKIVHGRIDTMTLFSDGNLFIGGNFTATSDGISYLNMARILSDGTLDRNFIQ